MYAIDIYVQYLYGAQEDLIVNPLCERHCFLVNFLGKENILLSVFRIHLPFTFELSLILQQDFMRFLVFLFDFI